MGRAFTFVVAKREEYDTLGLRPKWYPTGDPLGGMAAAHDVLEHFANDDGSTEGELQALGASLFVRGDGGYSSGGRYSRPYNCTQDPAADIPQVWGYHMDRENCRALRPCGVSRNAWGMEQARAIIAYALPELRHQWEDTLPSEGDRELMASWIAKGYARAQERYRRVIGGACSLASTFMNIERECDAVLAHAEEGAELTVYVNVMRSDVRVEVRYPFE